MSERVLLRGNPTDDGLESYSLFGCDTPLLARAGTVWSEQETIDGGSSIISVIRERILHIENGKETVVIERNLLGQPRMAEVKQFPKSRSERNRTVPEALEDAGKGGFTRAVIIGETEAGTVLVASEMTAAECLWIIEQGKRLLMGDDQ